MDWDDVTIKRDEADFERILKQWWRWALGKDYRPILMTVFGDWFLTDETGKISLLDLLDGAVDPVANSLEELKRKMLEPTTRDQWFLPGFVTAMQSLHGDRPTGQCFAYKLHPIIGGQLASSNLMLLDIEVWQSLCSQIHQQIRQIRTSQPTARVRGIEHLDGLKIRLITA
jgi:hypothetical protein